MTSADTITIVIGLTSSLKTGIKRHTAGDEERCALDVSGLITGQPNRSAPDFLRLGDSLVWYELEQFIVMLGCIPGLHVDWGADRSWRDRVHADPIRRDFLGDAFHHQNHAAFGRSVVHVTGPRDDFVHRADANNLSGAARDLRTHAAALELAD